jgi:hypothetical protein
MMTSHDGKPPRVPLLRPMRWMEDDAASVAIAPPIGRRFSMIIDEAALAQMGSRVVEAAIDQLGRTVPHVYASEIQTAVDRLLFDRAWLEPILENEIRRCAREFILSLWSDDEKKNLRDWFDVFTANIQPKVAAPGSETS